MEEKENDKGYRVVDKRGKDSDESSTEGDGFVMKESEKEEKSLPDQIDFSTFVFSLATNALINLGLTPDPITKKTQKNIPLAKQNIDILGMLKDKTKGNLTEEEDKLMESLLTEARLRFVEASN